MTNVNKKYCVYAHTTPSGKGNPFYGKKHSEQTKKRLCEVNRGAYVGGKSKRARKVACGYFWKYQDIDLKEVV